MTSRPLLTGDLTSDQQQLLEALYQYVTTDDIAHGEITTWPSWDHLIYLLEQEGIDAERAGQAAAGFPTLDRAYTPYSLIWRTQFGAGPVPHPDEQVGLTIAGLIRVDQAASDRLALMLARLAAREANLPPNPSGVREAQEPLNDLLTEFLKGPPLAGRVDMNVRTAAEMLMHEYTAVANETGRVRIYETALGRSKLAHLRGIETAGQYLDRIATLAPTPVQPSTPAMSTIMSATDEPPSRVSGSGTGLIRYQVFVSSTYKDLVAEREAVTQAVLRMGRCIPAGMELFSASTQPPWDVIRRTLDGTDYLILIIGDRSGALVPNEDISYTEKEYRYAVKHDIPVLAFLSSDDHPLLRSDIESPEAQRALDAFRNRIQSAQLTEEWTTKEDLASRVPNALWRAFEDTPRPGWVRGEPSPLSKRPSTEPPTASVKWSLKWFHGDRYILENMGEATAFEVALSAHESMIGPDRVEGGPGLEPDGALTFFAVQAMQTADSRIRVTWRPSPDAEPEEWSRPLPRRGD